MLARSRTLSFGSICLGSLYFGIVQICQGLSSFLYAKRVPILPRIFSWVLLKIAEVNESAYVYVGLYGYSYTAAAQNVEMLLENHGYSTILKHHLAGNIMLMANVTIGLLSGFIGLLFGAFEYKLVYQTGLHQPTTDGFL